jgi:predicted TIM-barrel fold metal-dependent hydrolase
MFIDIHGHLAFFMGPRAYPKNYLTMTVEQMTERQKKAGIEKTLLLPLIGPETYLPQSNEEILEVCRLHPDRFVPACNIDPRGVGNSPDSDFRPWLTWYKEVGKCRAVGEYMPNIPFCDPRSLNYLKQVEEVGLPLIFDASATIGGRYGIYDDPGLPQLKYCLKAFPKLKFFGHSQVFWSEIAPLADIDQRSGYPKGRILTEGVVPKLFRECPNLHGDLSAGSASNAMLRDEEYAVKFLNEFQDRLCFGTDWVTKDCEYPMANFLIRLRDDGKLSEMVFNKIARDNAKRIFII